MLLTLLLFSALIAIAALAILPDVAFQVKRDREEELIHRGVQYSRAIRRYVKKFGRYPTRLEDLDSTNQIRFLRKHYKDPMTGKDFKLLHLGEVQVAFGAGLPGATGVGQQPGTAGFGQTPNALSQNANTFGQANSAFGQSANALGPAAIAAQAQLQAAQAQGKNAAGAQSGDSDTKTDQNGGTSADQSAGDKLSAQVFGGGPIVGVASTSKDKTVREFNKKKHYNEWQFIYDPSTDRGGLLSTPNQPALQNAAPAVQQNPNGVSPGSIGIQVQNPQTQQPQQPQFPPDQNQPPQ